MTWLPVLTSPWRLLTSCFLVSRKCWNNLEGLLHLRLFLYRKFTWILWTGQDEWGDSWQQRNLNILQKEEEKMQASCHGSRVPRILVLLPCSWASWDWLKGMVSPRIIILLFYELIVLTKPPFLYFWWSIKRTETNQLIR